MNSRHKKQLLARVCVYVIRPVTETRPEMHIPPNLTPVLWTATSVLCVACIGLGAGFSLLFGNIRQQKRGLQCIWISLGFLAAAIVTVIMVVMHG